MRPILAFAAVASLLACAPSALAAPVPGVNWDREIARGGPTNVAPQFAEMGRARVGSVRTVFRWAEMQPDRGGTIFFTETDPIVAESVRNGFGTLPIVMTTPSWAQKYPGRFGSPPADARDYAQFLRRLVERYGPRGSFWLERPELPRRPLRHWQIWNEPEIRAYWNEPKFWRGYAKLVRAADRALAAVDPGARLVLAGSVGFSWESLDRLYRQGIKGHFDVAAIHPYTGSVEDVAEIVRRNRRVLARYGEPRKPVWITELSWPASKSRMKPPSGLRRVVTGDRGMADRLSRAFRYFEKPRNRRHRIGRLYWYTWASDYRGRSDVFDYAGLLRFRDGALRRMPAFHAFRRAAR